MFVRTCKVNECRPKGAIGGLYLSVSHVNVGLFEGSTFTFRCRCWLLSVDAMHAMVGLCMIYGKMCIDTFGTNGNIYQIIKMSRNDNNINYDAKFITVLNVAACEPYSYLWILSCKQTCKKHCRSVSAKS